MKTLLLILLLPITIMGQTLDDMERIALDWRWNDVESIKTRLGEIGYNFERSKEYFDRYFFARQTPNNLRAVSLFIQDDVRVVSFTSTNVEALNVIFRDVKRSYEQKDNVYSKMYGNIIYTITFKEMEGDRIFMACFIKN